MPKVLAAISLHQNKSHSIEQPASVWWKQPDNRLSDVLPRKLQVTQPNIFVEYIKLRHDILGILSELSAILMVLLTAPGLITGCLEQFLKPPINRDLENKIKK